MLHELRDTLRVGDFSADDARLAGETETGRHQRAGVVTRHPSFALANIRRRTVVRIPVRQWCRERGGSGGRYAGQGVGRGKSDVIGRAIRVRVWGSHDSKVDILLPSKNGEMFQRSVPGVLGVFYDMPGLLSRLKGRQAAARQRNVQGGRKSARRLDKVSHVGIPPPRRATEHGTERHIVFLHIRRKLIFDLLRGRSGVCEPWIRPELGIARRDGRWECCTRACSYSYCYAYAYAWTRRGRTRLGVLRQAGMRARRHGVIQLDVGP